MARKIAKRPNYSDVENSIKGNEKLCSTCWQPVYQPYIKGLWYHGNNHISNAYGCKNLVPVNDGEFRETEWSCRHEFKIISELTGAVKCSKCGFPRRLDVMDHENYKHGNGYFCITCNKPFAILAKHFIKIHHKKAFEFKEK